MHEEEAGYRVQVTDAADGGCCTLLLRDAFLNYAFSDRMKTILRAAVRERLDRGVRAFAVDLSAVSVMDSCGLSVLIGLHKLIDADGGRLVLVASSPILLRLFAITRLDRVFRIVPDLAAARTALAEMAHAESPTAPV